MTEPTAFSCDYCNFVCRGVESKRFFDHLARFHSNEPNFKVFCVSCPRSFTKINSLQKHFYRQHNVDDVLEVQEQPDDINFEGDVNEFEENFDEETARCDMKYHAAKFLLCAKEKGKLTQSALEMVKDSTNNLLCEYLDIVKKSLATKITDTIGQEFEFTQDMDKLFSAERVFEGLNSRHEQKSYFLRNFNMVSPVEVEMGKKWRLVHADERQIFKHVSALGYRVPLLKSLEALLQNPNVLHEIDNPHFSSDSLCDVMDGEFFNSHPIFSVHDDALQLIGYYDDLEIANPLGSKAKIHKIGVFYYVLGNIRPLFRSTVRNIQLICIAKTKDIKMFGINKLLMPFIQDVNSLAQENGHSFMINGVERSFRGGLLLWTGDTLGSNYISGFKEGVGGALRFCRHCMATRQESNEKFLVEQFQERNLASHRRICNSIEDPDNDKDVCAHLSTTYGVNRRSVLDNIEYFDVCKCMPEDIMHILLEGIVPYESKFLLRTVIDERRFLTLKELNHRISTFNYGYMNQKNKPTEITRVIINLTDTKLKQSASQMWCLFRFLPLLIGDKVDDQLENWHCFTKLWNIVQICTAPVITKDDAAYLKILINEHHTMFKRLYPDASIIPKMHYMVHIPDEIIRFGPPRNIWTMRFEAKHSFFKSCISKNFKNIPKSLSFSHQQNMCWNILTSPGQTITNYLYSGDVGPGDNNIDLCNHPHVQLLIKAVGLNELPNTFTGSRVKHVEIHGIKYKPGCALRLKEMDDFGDHDYPSYGRLEEIIIWEDGKFFVVQVLQTLQFMNNFMSYEVVPTDERVVVSLKHLPWHGVLNIVKRNDNMFIVEKDSANVELDI